MESHAQHCVTEISKASEPVPEVHTSGSANRRCSQLVQRVLASQCKRRGFESLCISESLRCAQQARAMAPMQVLTSSMHLYVCEMLLCHFYHEHKLRSKILKLGLTHSFSDQSSLGHLICRKTRVFGPHFAAHKSVRQVRIDVLTCLPLS